MKRNPLLPEGTWFVIQSTCTTQGAEGVSAYGVAFRNANRVIWKWDDVDISRPLVQKLVQRLNDQQPEPCHWEEIIRDYIEEIGGLLP